MVQAVKAGQGKEGKAWREGSVRCTFEDKILMSDIVFLRAWTKVDIPRFFNPVTTLLQAKTAQWQGMKTVGELRRIQHLHPPVNSDSLYKVFNFCKHHFLLKLHTNFTPKTKLQNCMIKTLMIAYSL